MNKNTIILLLILFFGLFFIYVLTNKEDDYSNYVSMSLEESIISNSESNKSDLDLMKDAVSNALNKGALEKYITDVDVNENNDDNDNKSESSKNAYIEVISSNKIKILNGDEEIEARLIGVSPNDNIDKLTNLINNMKNKPFIEQDIKKKESNVVLIYLWDGEPGDVNNMINIQMVKNGFAKSTYETGSSIIESPNILYFGKFIEASKESRRE